MEGGVLDGMNNSTKYREVRKYLHDNSTKVLYFFITACFGEYIEMLLKKLMKPDIIFMNSCLWDIHRYGTKGYEGYGKNLSKLVKEIKTRHPNTLFTWTTTPPVAMKTKAGFIIDPEKNYVKVNEVLKCNDTARQIMTKEGIPFADFAETFKHFVHHRAGDGVHWNERAHRRMTNILLEIVSRHFNKSIPRPVSDDFNRSNEFAEFENRPPFPHSYSHPEFRDNNWDSFEDDRWHSESFNNGPIYNEDFIMGLDRSYGSNFSYFESDDEMSPRYPPLPPGRRMLMDRRSPPPPQIMGPPPVPGFRYGPPNEQQMMLRDGRKRSREEEYMDGFNKRPRMEPPGRRLSGPERRPPPPPLDWRTSSPLDRRVPSPLEMRNHSPLFDGRPPPFMYEERPAIVMPEKGRSPLEQRPPVNKPPIAGDKRPMLPSKSPVNSISGGKPPVKTPVPGDEWKPLLAASKELQQGRVNKLDTKRNGGVSAGHRKEEDFTKDVTFDDEPSTEVAKVGDRVLPDEKPAVDRKPEVMTSGNATEVKDKPASSAAASSTTLKILQSIGKASAKPEEDIAKLEDSAPKDTSKEGPTSDIIEEDGSEKSNSVFARLSATTSKILQSLKNSSKLFKSSTTSKSDVNDVTSNATVSNPIEAAAARSDTSTTSLPAKEGLKGDHDMEISGSELMASGDKDEKVEVIEDDDIDKLLEETDPVNCLTGETTDDIADGNTKGVTAKPKPKFAFYDVEVSMEELEASLDNFDEDSYDIDLLDEESLLMDDNEKLPDVATSSTENKVGEVMKDNKEDGKGSESKVSGSSIEVSTAVSDAGLASSSESKAVSVENVNKSAESLVAAAKDSSSVNANSKQEKPGNNSTSNSALPATNTKIATGSVASAVTGKNQPVKAANIVQKPNTQTTQIKPVSRPVGLSKEPAKSIPKLPIKQAPKPPLRELPKPGPVQTQKQPLTQMPKQNMTQVPKQPLGHLQKHPLRELPKPVMKDTPKSTTSTTQQQKSSQAPPKFALATSQAKGVPTSGTIIPKRTLSGPTQPPKPLAQFSMGKASVGTSNVKPGPALKPVGTTQSSSTVAKSPVKTSLVSQTGKPTVPTTLAKPVIGTATKVTAPSKPMLGKPVKGVSIKPGQNLASQQVKVSSASKPPSHQLGNKKSVFPSQVAVSSLNIKPKQPCVLNPPSLDMKSPFFRPKTTAGKPGLGAPPVTAVAGTAVSKPSGIQSNSPVKPTVSAAGKPGNSVNKTVVQQASTAAIKTSAPKAVTSTGKSPSKPGTITKKPDGVKKTPEKSGTTAVNASPTAKKRKLKKAGDTPKAKKTKVTKDGEGKRKVKKVLKDKKDLVTKKKKVKKIKKVADTKVTTADSDKNKDATTEATTSDATKSENDTEPKSIGILASADRPKKFENRRPSQTQSFTPKSQEMTEMPGYLVQEQYQQQLAQAQMFSMQQTVNTDFGVAAAAAQAQAQNAAQAQQLQYEQQLYAAQAAQFGFVAGYAPAATSTVFNAQANISQYQGAATGFYPNQTAAQSTDPSLLGAMSRKEYEHLAWM